MFTPRGLGLRGKFYAQPYVGLNIKFIESTKYYVLILFVAISTVYFLISIYKYNMISLSRRKHRQYFESSYKSANTSSQAFIHAFKNDLFAIQTLSDIDSNIVTSETYESRFKGIHEVSTACMLRFDLLQKATNHPTITLETVKVSQLINDTIRLISPLVSTQIEMDVAPIPNDLTVYTDRIQVVEVVRNLITNSIESLTGEHGKVRVEANRRGRWVVIKISDNGRGIPKEELKKIFTPYYSTKPSTKNWGLGLSFCRRIVQMLDGDIHVKSEEGQGSKFYVYLPLPPLKKYKTI